jgi:hypothetical protein
MAEARANSLSRLLAAIHVFEGDPRLVCAQDRSAGMKIAPRDGGDVDEVYLVPAQYYDAVALLRVDHDTRTICFVRIYEGLLPEEDAPGQWDEIRALAAASLDSAKTKRGGKDL